MRKLFFCFLCSLTALFANSIEQIKERGVLKIGLDTDQAPFSKYVDEQFIGFEADMARAIAKNIFGDSIEVKLIPTHFNNGISDLQSKRIDMFINAMTITDERAKLVDFSMPYFAVNIGFLTMKSDRITKLSDLSGEKIIGFKDTTTESFLKQRGFDMVYCETAGDGYKMLKDGKGAAYADDNLIVLAFPVLDKEVEVSIQNLGDTDFLGVAIRKNSKELLDAINNSLIKLSREGFFRKNFDQNLNPYYKGTAEKKYFLLDDIYSIFG
ncbi:MAG: transporter substrate-binding domain-containing protein [Campylobacteraceae bacterium]|nr:transporter substrate-binding domain-containing protein [Campylobacteraceae bacterium]